MTFVDVRRQKVAELFAGARTDPYSEFLRAKAPIPAQLGVPIEAADVSPVLFPHQRDIVRWAVAGGRRAIFAQFGLGKTLMQLEVLRLILASLPAGRALVVCPLGVRAEFMDNADKLGIARPRFVNRTEQVDGPGLYITNYEPVRDGKLDVTVFDAVSLDEAAVLRSYGSKTFQEFMDLFASVRYRFVATATPSPNRYKELIHYAGFLGVMDTGQALTRFFQRDSTKANNLTLYPHKEREFWAWLSSWAVFLTRPSDLGYPDDGFDLPDHHIEYREVEVDPLTAVHFESQGQGQMFHADGLGVRQAAAEKRATLDDRVAEAMRVLDEWPVSPDEQVVFWVDLNDEQDAICAALAARGVSHSSVHGSLSIDETERRIAAWKARETVALVGKPVQLGQGLNLQQARLAVFVGLTHKFNQVIQAVHRIWRFGQLRPCHTFIVHADTERSIVGTIREKWQRHEELLRTMTDLIREHGLNDSFTDVLQRSLGVERVQASGAGWVAVNNDCVIETEQMDTDSVDLVVTSIPFSNHYEYTPSYNDFGHTDDNEHFWAQMDFLTPQLLRVLRPGRIYACHVKDRILFSSMTDAGSSTVSPFHAEAILHGRYHGFDYMGMITVTTDVVRENNQSYRLGYAEMCKDGTKMGVGSPEYVLLFRKPQTDRTKGYADTPVTRPADKTGELGYGMSRWQIDAHAYWRSSGDRHLTPEEWAALPIQDAMRLWESYNLAHVYDLPTHVAIGDAFEANDHRLPKTFMAFPPGSNHPDVWSDVTRMLTLNTEQSRKRQALHVCPLQFDIVDRLIERYSNPGDLVYDPFGGLSTVAYRALHLGRQGRTTELNPGYFADAVRYLQAAENQLAMPTLFDLDPEAAS